MGTQVVEAGKKRCSLYAPRVLNRRTGLAYHTMRNKDGNGKCMYYAANIARVIR